MRNPFLPALVYPQRRGDLRSPFNRRCSCFGLPVLEHLRRIDGVLVCHIGWLPFFFPSSQSLFDATTFDSLWLQNHACVL